MGNDILAVDVRRRPRQTGFYGWVQRWVVWAMFAISQQRSVKIDRVGGEGGIRTLGPPQGGQRFSRPPRSTAPAPLHPNGGKGLSWPRRRTKPEIGTRLAPVKGAGTLPPLLPSPRSYRRWRRGAPVGARG